MRSTSFRELCATITHTERDTLELVDPALVAAAAEFVADLVRSLPAVGGAMDLVAGVRKIHIITTHTTKHGQPKLLEQCTYPLTGKAVVDRIYTDLAVIDVETDGFVIKELGPGVDFETVRQKTGLLTEAFYS